MGNAIKGKKYIIINKEIEYKTKDFKVGDIVISLENDRVPYVVKKEAFNGSFYLRDYDIHDYTALIYDKDIVDVDSNDILINMSNEEQLNNFIDYLIENASYAFEHQDRDLLEKVLKGYKVK